MPFDFVAYEASCRLLHPEQLQLEWENYTRQISGGATSTGASVAFAPVTGGISLLGLGLSAPKIHNARKKREIIERCLAIHGQVPNTRKRDVMGPAAVAGGISVLTLGLAAPGAEALGGEVAAKGAEYVVAHVALDGAGAAGEHVHGEQHRKKKNEELQRRRPLPGYIPAQPGQLGAVPIPPQAYPLQHTNQQTNLYASQTQWPFQQPHQDTLDQNAMPQIMGSHQQAYGFQAPGPVPQQYQQAPYNYQNPAVPCGKTESYPQTQILSHEEKSELKVQQIVPVYTPASPSQNYPQSPFQQPGYEAQPVLNLQTKPIMPNRYSAPPLVLSPTSSSEYATQSPYQHAPQAQEPFMKNTTYQSNAIRDKCEPPSYSTIDLLPSDTQVLNSSHEEHHNIVTGVETLSQPRPQSPGQLTIRLETMTISNEEPEKFAHRLQNTGSSTPAPPYIANVTDPSLVPKALFTRPPIETAPSGLQQPAYTSETHLTGPTDSSEVSNQRPETLIHQDSGYQSGPPTPIHKISDDENPIENQLSNEAVIDSSADVNIDKRVSQPNHSHSSSVVSYSQPVQLQPLHSQHRPQLPNLDHDWNIQQPQIRQPENLSTQSPDKLQQSQQSYTQDQTSYQLYSATQTTQGTQQSTGFHQKQNDLIELGLVNTQSQNIQYQQTQPYQALQPQNHEYRPTHKTNLQTSSEQEKNNPSISQPQIYTTSTAPTQTYYPPPSISFQMPQFASPPPQIPNQTPRYGPSPSQTPSKTSNQLPNHPAPPPQTPNQSSQYPGPPPQLSNTLPYYPQPPPQTLNQTLQYTASQSQYLSQPQNQHQNYYPSNHQQGTQIQYQYQPSQNAQFSQHAQTLQPQIPYFAPPPVAMSHPGSQIPAGNGSRRQSVLMSGISSLSSNLSSRFGK